MLSCLNCNKELTGRQRKFCSIPCKNIYNNKVFQNYENQKKRGEETKTHFIDLLGGKCSICGYNRNHTALCFHHLDPKEKEIKLSSREMSNNKLEKLTKEVEKCILVCLNCHSEIHHPNRSI